MQSPDVYWLPSDFGVSQPVTSSQWPGSPVDPQSVVSGLSGSLPS